MAISAAPSELQLYTNELDSLVYKLEIAKAIYLIDKHELIIETGDFLERQKKVHEIYKANIPKLSELLDDLNSMTDEQCLQIVNINLNRRNSFTEEKYSKNAKSSYSKFEQLAKEGEILPALQYYFIARYFKIIHVSVLESIIEEKFILLDQLISQGNYQVALDLNDRIQEMLIEQQSFKPYHDMCKNNEFLIDQGLTTLRQDSLLYQQDKLVSNK